MKKVIDYSITPVYFYRFVCNDPNITNMYVGSCIDLTKRKYRHKTSCNNPNDKGHNYLVYKTIRENGGWNNWRMLEIEHKIVNNKSESKQQEQYWIEYFNAQMNMRKLNFNRQEYHEQHREQHREQRNAYNREYHEQHREQKNAYSREYNEQHREQKNAHQREYHEQHREQRNAYQREYRKRKKQENLNVIEVV